MNYSKISLLVIFVSILILDDGTSFAAAKRVRKRGVMDNLNDGIKYAGQMFGINTAADVANLVAKAFSSATSSTTNRKKPDFMSIFQQNGNNRHDDTQRKPQSQSQEDSKEPFEQQRVRDGPADSSSGTPQRDSPTLDLNTTRLIKSVLKMVGFDAGKLGALAINALIMVAQAIGNTIMNVNRNTDVNLAEGGRWHASSTSGPEETYEDQTSHQPRKLRDGSPIDWFLENPTKEMRSLLTEITDAKLSDRLTDLIAQAETETGQGSCLKMLICKSSPFIWGMQKSVAKRLGKATGQKQPEEQEEEEENYYLSTKGFFKHLPSIEEFRKHGEHCEKIYSNFCNTTAMYKH